MCSLVSVGGLVVGCDSGGSNGGDSTNLKGSVTVELTEASSSNSNAKATLDGEFTATFTYVNESDSDCNEFARIGVSGDTPYKDELSPTLDRCEGDDFDEVEVSYVPSSGSASGLSLSVLSNGNEVAAVSSPNATGNLSVTASDGGQNSGDTGGGDGDNSKPAWVGNWKNDEGNFVISLSTEKAKEVEKRDNNSCVISSYSVTNIDGNTIDVDEQNGGTATFNIESVSESTIEISSSEFSGTVTYQSADDDKTPEEILGCP